MTVTISAMSCTVDARARGSRGKHAGMLMLALAAGCDQPAARSGNVVSKTPGATSAAAIQRPGASVPATPAPPAATTRFPAADRVVALGDIHGDLGALRAALMLAGVLDAADHWTGGATVVVQTGDLLDRGNDEQAIVDLLDQLEKEAAAQGGAVHVLNGNHELMNAALDFRYVTPEGFVDFADAPGVNASDPDLLSLPPAQRARASAFLPGGAYARKLARHPVAIVVGDTVFCHGGILPKYAAELDRINQQVAEWLSGGAREGMGVLQADDGPVWSRHYSADPDASDCALLDHALNVLHAARMVVGHTVQPSINSACDDKVWRIDVGMSAYYHGKPEVLELTTPGPRVLR